MAICLAFFPPSQKFDSYLEAYTVKHLQEKDSDTNFVLQFLGSQVCRHCQLGDNDGTVLAILSVPHALVFC